MLQNPSRVVPQPIHLCMQGQEAAADAKRLKQTEADGRVKQAGALNVAMQRVLGSKPGASASLLNLALPSVAKGAAQVRL